MSEPAPLLHSHIAHRIATDRVLVDVDRVLRSLVAAGFHPVTVHGAALKALDTFRVSHMTPVDLEAQFRHPTARMGGAELAQLVRDRMADGWPADGKPIA